MSLPRQSLEVASPTQQSDLLDAVTPIRFEDIKNTTKNRILKHWDVVVPDPYFDPSEDLYRRRTCAAITPRPRKTV